MATASLPPADERAKGRRRRLLGPLAAVASVVLFGWGSLLLADWLHERAAVTSRIARDAAPGPEASASRPEPAPDPRMAVWLDAGVKYSPARRVDFGRDRAYFVSGTSPEGPIEVFPRLLKTWAAGMDRAALESVVSAGPSAAVALRLHATIGTVAGGAYFVRVPPDVEAARRGAMRTEPGGVVLAFHAHGHWDYLTFYFPEGLDLDALVRSSKAPVRALDRLGPGALSALEPALSLPADGPGAASTVLCRARGPAGAAIDRVAEGLSRRGWRDAEQGVKEKSPGTRVLTGPAATVWMTTADREQVGGLVTVLIGTP